MEEILSAASAGGILSIKSDSSTNDFRTVQTELYETATGNLRIPFTGKSTDYLALEANFTGNQILNFNPYSFYFTPVFDITLLKINKVFDIEKDTLTVCAGRFSTIDLTGYILGQTLDGASLKYESDKFNVTCLASWTGLTNAQNITILEDSSSWAVTADYSKPYLFNTPYVISDITVVFPFVLFNQSISAEVIGLVGTKGLNNTNNEGIINTYSTISLNGPLSSSIFYNASSTLYIKDFTDFKAAFMTSFTLNKYFTAYNSVITAKALYVSGNNGMLTSFKSITSLDASYAYTPASYSGLIKGGIEASFKFVPVLYTQLGGDLIFLCPDSSVWFDGGQIYTTIKYAPFTDFDISLTASRYIAKSEGNNNTKATLIFNFAF